MIFDAHACRHLADGVSVLRVDTRVDCAADSYTVIQMVGWLMGACWVFGVPFYWLLSLLTNREAIQTTGEDGQATVAARRFVSPILQTSQRVDRAPTHRSCIMRCVIWCMPFAPAHPPARLQRCVGFPRGGLQAGLWALVPGIGKVISDFQREAKRIPNAYV